jgi:hypothetical protein
LSTNLFSYLLDAIGDFVAMFTFLVSYFCFMAPDAASKDSFIHLISSFVMTL